MNDIWKTLIFNEFAFKQVREELRASKDEFLLSYDGVVETNKLFVSKAEAFGIIEHQLVVSNARRAFIDSVIRTENFLKDVATEVYKDFPAKLSISEKDVESDKRGLKLLNVILESVDKNEMLSKIAEEKIRSIFYGNPKDFFVKDQANIGLKRFFTDNHSKTLEAFSEIIARRNIYVHNNGKVDRKYLREVKGSSLKLGQKAVIDSDYAKNAIMILKALGVLVTVVAVKSTYQVSPRTGSRTLRQYKAVNRRLNI